MIDTHSHIYLKDFTEDLQPMLSRAEEVGVEKIYLPNIDSDSIQDLKKLATGYAHCLPMMGLHPGSVKENYQEELAIIMDEIDSNPDYYVGIGEIGIDLYWDKTYLEAQKFCFGAQIEKAKELNLPIIIHCRDAFDEVFEVLEKHNSDSLHGIFHCFTGNLEQAKTAINFGLKLGIGGVVTFKNAGLDKVVEQLDLNDLVLETDAPYLTPAPFRGKRNEPSYIQYTAQKIADLHHIPLSELDEISTKNAQEVFKR
jgi:TatD DNase family protein